MVSKKVLIGIGVGLVVLLVVSLVMYRTLKFKKNEVERQAQSLLERNGEFSSQSNEAQIAELKEALLYLAKEVGTQRGIESANNELSSLNNRVVSPNITGSLSSGTSADLLLRIKALEDKVAVLENRPAASPGSSSSIKGVQYIPLGGASELNDRNGITLSSYEITLDPADFPNYATMQLEVVMRLSESVGTLSMNLFNVTDNQAITSSDISTNSSSFILGSSFSFRLSSGRKTYRIWAKSSEGYSAYIQSARLKVSY